MDEPDCTVCKKEDTCVPRMKNNAYCRPCRNKLDRYRGARKRVVSTPSTITPSDSELNDSESSQPETCTRCDSLYVMCYDFDPCHTMGLKVGRASNVDARALQLGKGHAFRMHVLATFPGLGRIEHHVHSLLSSSRATTGRGIEWFHSPLSSVLHAIAVSAHEHTNVCHGSTL